MNDVSHVLLERAPHLNDTIVKFQRRKHVMAAPEFLPLRSDRWEEYLHRLGSKLYDAADLPIWRCRYVNIYQNTDAALTRLEQEEMDSDLYHRWIDEQAMKFPEASKQDAGSCDGDDPDRCHRDHKGPDGIAVRV